MEVLESLLQFALGLLEQLWWLLAVVLFSVLDFLSRLQPLLPQRWQQARQGWQRWLSRHPRWQRFVTAVPLLRVFWVSLLAIAIFLTYHDLRVATDARITELQQQVSDRVSRQEKADLLSKLYEDGNAIFNRAVTNDDEMVRWDHDLNEWLARAVSEIEQKLSAAEATSFWYIGSVPAKKYFDAFNEHHNIQLGRLDAWLDNLRDLLNKYM